MSNTSKETLLKKSNLLKECGDAYRYAVEVISKDSPAAEVICRSSAEICQNCAEECADIESATPSEDPTYDMCLEYASLCEELLNYVHVTDQEKIEKTM